MNTLKTIQKVFCIAKILCQIVFVCCIVGCCLCIAAAVSLAVDIPALSIGGVNIVGLVETQEGRSGSVMALTILAGAFQVAALHPGQAGPALLCPGAKRRHTLHPGRSQAAAAAGHLLHLGARCGSNHCPGDLPNPVQHRACGAQQRCFHRLRPGADSPVPGVPVRRRAAIRRSIILPHDHAKGAAHEPASQHYRPHVRLCQSLPC